MDELRGQGARLAATWKEIDENHLTEAVCKAKIPGISLVQLREAVTTTCSLFNKVNPPQGFAPTYSLARALASTSLNAALETANLLQAGSLDPLPDFVHAINSTLSAFHTMLVVSDKHDFVADLAVQQQESLALLDTAQKELKAKQDALAATAASERKLKEAAKAIDETANKTQGILNRVIEIRKSSDEELAAVKTGRETVEQTQKDMDAHALRVRKLLADLVSQEQRMAKLNEESKSQSELIAKLLPMGASAGLAHAFGSRARALDTTKKIWMIGFATSIGLLALLAGRVLMLNLSSKEDLWIQLLHHIPLASPLIWLGWFSAVQYGNTIRVQEDYAFKEATSNAFAGYRDHMQHLAKIKTADGANAMELLATSTIEILAKEPLRIYNKPDRDVSPAQTLIEIWRARREKNVVKAAREATAEE